MEESYLYCDLTVRENLELYCNLYGASMSCVEEVSNLLDVRSFLDHEVAMLSRGQKQRASLARAILPKPHILLFDEPFSGLDAASVRHVCEFLNGFKRSDDLALIATHELEIVKDMADGLLLLDGGRIRYFGKFNAL